MPAARSPLDAPPTALPGVGPARAERLARLGVTGVRDLLLLVPRRVAEPASRTTIAAARAAVGREVAVAGRVRSVSIHRAGRRRTLVRARVERDGSAIDALFFNQPWQHARLQRLRDTGEEIELTGRVVATKSGPALASPSFGDAAGARAAADAPVPIYPLKEGLGQGFVRRIAREAAERWAHLLVEPLPARALAEHDLPPLPEAARDLHLAPDAERFERARRRAALEAALVLQARVAERRAARLAGSARPVTLARERWEALLARLPWPPTGAQRRVVTEIAADLARPRPMRRLLQGDVGAGKTAVALVAAMAVVEAGGQAALMAPTEILAEQHFEVAAPLLARAGMRATLVVGSLEPARRRAAAADVAEGRAGVVVGTHALLSSDVAFARLDLAVIDEQQRFGVAQRRGLLAKGADVHALLVTATPIPRTLALTLYGDLDVSVLDEKPPGRARVETHLLTGENRARLLEDLARRLERGERVLWVAPRIAAADDEDGEAVAAAEEVHARLARTRFARHGIELLHGRLPRAEREARLARFRRGDSLLLVGTSVVEVGLDVPEATAVVIEGAERFGLAQLHQLRGRVGRGAAPSLCLLRARPAARERLAVLERTDDGFAIAEEDLRRRGMGDLAGLRQSGPTAEGLDPERDLDLLVLARDLVARHPSLRAHYAAQGRAAEPT